MSSPAFAFLGHHRTLKGSDGESLPIYFCITKRPINSPPYAYYMVNLADGPNGTILDDVFIHDVQFEPDCSFFARRGRGCDQERLANLYQVLSLKCPSAAMFLASAPADFQAPTPTYRELGGFNIQVIYRYVEGDENSENEDGEGAEGAEGRGGDEPVEDSSEDDEKME